MRPGCELHFWLRRDRLLRRFPARHFPLTHGRALRAASLLRPCCGLQMTKCFEDKTNPKDLFLSGQNFFEKLQKINTHLVTRGRRRGRGLGGRKRRRHRARVLVHKLCDLLTQVHKCWQALGPVTTQLDQGVEARALFGRDERNSRKTMKLGSDDITSFPFWSILPGFEGFAVRFDFLI